MTRIPNSIIVRLEEHKRSSDSDTSRAALQLHAQLAKLVSSDTPADTINAVLVLAGERLDILHSLSLPKYELAFLEPAVIGDIAFRVACLVNDRQDDNEMSNNSTGRSSPPCGARTARPLEHRDHPADLLACSPDHARRSRGIGCGTLHAGSSRLKPHCRWPPESAHWRPADPSSW